MSAIVLRTAMGALRFRVGRRLAASWRSGLVVALVTAAVCATVLTFAAGARRTATAPARYEAANRSDIDALLNQTEGAPRLTELAALDAVQHVDSMTFLMGGLLGKDGEGLDMFSFAGDAAATGAKLVEGRAPDPKVPSEFVATRALLDRSGLAVGDTLRFVSLSESQADQFGFLADLAPEGPSFDARLVGVVEGARDGDPTRPEDALAVFPLSVLDGRPIPLRTSVMTVELRPGADLDTLRSQLAALPDAQQFELATPELVSDSVRTAIRAQAAALGVLAAVSGIAAVTVLGQLAARRSRLDPIEVTSLSALGMTARWQRAESTCFAAVPVALGALVSVPLAFALSRVFPTGLAGALEPNRGVSFDAAVLLPGATLLASAMCAWSFASLSTSRTRGDAVRPSLRRPPAFSAGVGVLLPSLPAALGFRFACTAQGTRRTALSAFAGTVGAVAATVGALTFGSSVDRLIDQPFRYGGSFDLTYGDSGQVAPPDEVRAQLERDPDVAGLTLLASSQLTVEDLALPVVAFEYLSGPDPFSVLAGHMPSAADQLALGRRTARQLEVDVGDTLTLSGPAGSKTFTVSGLVVVPGSGGVDGVGEDALLTLAGLRQLEPEATGVALGIMLDPSKDAAEAAARLQETYGLEAAGYAQNLPEPIRNLDRVRTAPFMLAAVLGALSLLTLGHALATSLRRQRRPLAILSAMGADRHDLRAVVGWHATLQAFMPTLVALPLGALVGSALFRAMADNIGVVNGARLPLLSVATIVMAAIAFANVTAGASRWLERRSQLDLLRPE